MWYSSSSSSLNILLWLFVCVWSFLELLLSDYSEFWSDWWVRKCSCDFSVAIYKEPASFFRSLPGFLCVYVLGMFRSWFETSLIQRWNQNYFRFSNPSSPFYLLYTYMNSVCAFIHIYLVHMTKELSSKSVLPAPCLN